MQILKTMNNKSLRHIDISQFVHFLVKVHSKIFTPHIPEVRLWYKKQLKTLNKVLTEDRKQGAGDAPGMEARSRGGFLGSGLELEMSQVRQQDTGNETKTMRPVLLEGAEVEAVDSYRYLGLWLDNKLDWTTHTSHLYGKTESRMYFLRRLRSFNICSKLLQMFYQSVVASVLFYTVVCWGGSISKKGHIQTG
ncbi:hypothetical protein L3Q82_004249 [Scortum barcoo]|uniref:Uncharacterized protein n=1 Tax=Scortum barcoo TaxID=214431 RepID=A0ACB8VJK8_9TELE|nr:hypothetical protein L3Q82_004249 [Scortum barcoo]